jgi:patatin-like phospholipase/acyl hydrolase
MQKEDSINNQSRSVADQGLNPTVPKNKFKILSINGGGCRGIIPAHILDYVEKRTGKPIWTMFDMVTGTSTGGILTCGITSPYNYTMENMVDLYKKEASNIFRKRLIPYVGSTYKLEGLTSTMEKYFKNSLFGQAKTRAIVYGRDTLNRQNLVFKSYSPEWNELAVKTIASATAAAPSYFPAVIFNHNNSARVAVDGGLFANNPSLLAIEEANQLGFEDKDIIILNMGTGYTTSKPVVRANPNILSVATDVIDEMFDASSLAAINACKNSKAKYKRIDLELDPKKADMDKYQNIPYWLDMADETIALNGDILDNVEKFLEMS